MSPQRVAPAIVLGLVAAVPNLRAEEPTGPVVAPAPDGDERAVPVPPTSEPPATGADAPVVGATPAVASRPAPDATPPRWSFTPIGLLRLAGAMVQDDPAVAFVGRADGFELGAAQAGIDARLGQRIRARLVIDGALDERERVNEPNGTLRVGLRDAFAEFALGGEVLAVRAGQFEPWFDGEDFTSVEHRWFVDTALANRGVRATEGFQVAGLAAGRSIGVALRRDPRRPQAGAALGFEVALQNGAGELASSNDNDWVAASAAVVVRLPDGGFVLASGRVNPRAEGELPLRQDETDLAGAIAAEVGLGRVRVAAGAVAQRTLYPSTDAPDENAWGAHAAGWVWLRDGVPRIGAGYRFSIFDPSDLVRTDRLMEHTLGATAAWPAHHLRALLGVTHADEQGGRELVNGRLEAALEFAL